MADLMEEEDAMALNELECPATAEEKLLEMALEECETDSQNAIVVAGHFSKRQQTQGAQEMNWCLLKTFRRIFVRHCRGR
jgi:hypothetical protein